MKESALDPAAAVVDVTLPAGQGWTQELARGDVFRIVDLEGNQAVDTLFFNAATPTSATARPRRCAGRATST